MNLTLLKANGYKVFNRQKPENKAANITALQYIEGLASRTNTDIAGWNLLDMFGGPGRSEYDLLKDKNEINRIFFEAEAKSREDGDANLQQIKAMVGDRIREIANVLRNRKVAEKERNYTAAVAQADQYANNVQEYLKRAYITWQEIQTLKNQTSNIENEAIGVLRDKFWKFRDFNGSNIYYETVSELVLTEINPAAGLNVRANLGKFVVEVTLETMALKVHPLGAFTGMYYLNYDGIYHPHVSSDGNICWGDAKANALGLQSRGELTKLMNLLASLLSTYSPSHPYAALIKFQQLEQERERKQNGQATQAEAQQGQTQQGQIIPNLNDIWGTIVRDGGLNSSAGATNTIVNGSTLVGPGTELNQHALDAIRYQMSQQQIIGRHINGQWQVDYEVGPPVTDGHANRSANAEIHQAIRDSLGGQRATSVWVDEPVAVNQSTDDEETF